MQNVLSVYKPIGVTPLEIINKVKQKLPEYLHEKITYAGRLDPLAHGVLILLVDESIKQKDSYLQLPKTYEFEIILGIESDTYDVLGVVNNNKNNQYTAYNVNSIVNSFVNKHTGILTQKYPPYSSKAVNGKPLFWWAKEKKLHEIVIPEHDIEIFAFKKIAEKNIKTEKLEQHIKNTINKISGDFRQKEITEKWQEFFDKNDRHIFQALRFRIECSSGTYVRSLTHELGKQLGSGAIAYEIYRTRVGEFDLKATLHLE